MAAAESAKSQIPTKAAGDGDDIAPPTTALLRELNLLPSPEDLKAASGFVAAFTGPPESVAVIEAGATAATKWSSAGLGAALAAVWAAVAGFWGGITDEVRVAVLLAGGLLSAAVVIAIGLLLSSDVRGRAAASVATIQARSLVAQAMTVAAQKSARDDGATAVEVTALQPGLTARNHARPSADEDGWRVIALERSADGSIKYRLVKGSREALVSPPDLSFD